MDIGWSTARVLLCVVVLPDATPHDALVSVFEWVLIVEVLRILEEEAANLQAPTQIVNRGRRLLCAHDGISEPQSCRGEPVPGIRAQPRSRLPEEGSGKDRAQRRNLESEDRLDRGEAPPHETTLEAGEGGREIRCGLDHDGRMILGHGQGAEKAAAKRRAALEKRSRARQSRQVFWV